MNEYDVRPTFSVGSNLSHTFDAFWSNAGRFVAMIFMLMVPLAVMAFLIGFATARSGAPTALGIIINIASMFAGSLLLAASVHGAVEARQGHEVRIGDCLSVAFSRVLPLVGVSVVFGLGTVVLGLLLIIPGIIFAVAYCMALPITVVEKRGVFASLSRAAQLSKGHRWTLLGTYLAFWLVSMGCLLFIWVLICLTSSIGGVMVVPAVLLGLVMFIGYLSVLSMSQVLLGVTYHQLRAEKEGFHEERIAGVFE